MIDDAVGGIKYLMPCPAGTETEIDVFTTIFEFGIEAAEFEKDIFPHQPAGGGHTLEFLTELSRAEVRRLSPVKMHRAFPGIKDHPGVVDEVGAGTQVPVSDDGNGRVTAGSRKKLLQPASSHQRVVVKKAKILPLGERNRAIDVFCKTFSGRIPNRPDAGAERLQILHCSIHRFVINDDDFEGNGFLCRLKYAFETSLCEIQAVVDGDKNGDGGQVSFRTIPLVVLSIPFALFKTQHTGAEFMPDIMISWQNSVEQGL